jgi:bifunctional non-homologous end joining protein LigD
MKRTAGFIEPCLPSLADCPPSGSEWLHEIKHDGFRLLACRDPAGIRLSTRNANDFTARYPLIVEAVESLPVRTCVIDGEAVACDGNGLSIFEKLRWRHHDERVFMWCFDLLELNGRDLRREPIEVRKAALARLLKKAVSIRAARSGRRARYSSTSDASMFQFLCKRGSSHGRNSP